SSRFFFDRADETEALAVNRADQALLFAAVVDRLPHSIDVACQRRVGHDSAVPDSLNQIVLADHALPVLQQIDQQVEHLRSDRDLPGPTCQLPPLNVECQVFEYKNHVSPQYSS